MCYSTIQSINTVPKSEVPMHITSKVNYNRAVSQAEWPKLFRLRLGLNLFETAFFIVSLLNLKSFVPRMKAILHPLWMLNGAKCVNLTSFLLLVYEREYTQTSTNSWVKHNVWRLPMSICFSMKKVYILKKKPQQLWNLYAVIFEERNPGILLCFFCASNAIVTNMSNFATLPPLLEYNCCNLRLLPVL